MKNALITAIILSATLITNCFSQNVGWEVVQSNTSLNLNSIFFFDHQFGFACGDSGVVLKSIDSGKTWQTLQSPITFDQNDCFMSAQECFLSVGDSASWLSSIDGGLTWFYIQMLDLVGDIYSLSFFPRAQNFYDGIYGADSLEIMIGNSVYCSNVINDTSKNGPGGFYAAYMLNSGIGFVAGENSSSQPIVGRANNYPQGWDFISFYLDGKEGRATGVAFTDSLNGFISAIVWDGGGAISKSTDNGDTWTTKFFSHPLHSISFPISGTSQIGYCAGDSGAILKTSNAGENWYNQISPTSERLNKVYFVDQNFGFAVGDNGTILRTTDGGITSITEDKVSGVLNFELQQNYPNPFNPATKIRFRIADFGFVSLKVYDILGNLITTLVDEYKNPGSYEVEINTSTIKPQPSSGVYFYTLRSNNFMATKKLVLMK